VVIPAYNAAAFIEKTLDSVRAQTCTDYEVIVTDDGSADRTQAAVEGWLARRKIAGRCIRQPNKGIAGARNTAMRAASGAYIALLDHDDLWYPGKLAAAAEAFKSHPDAVLVGHHINMTKDGKLVALVRKGPAVPRMYERLLFVGNALTPSASVFRKDKALEIGGFRENPEFNTSEDYDFWMRLSRVGPFYFIDEALAEYPVVENSASSPVEYHHASHEAVLRDHFASYFQGAPGPWDRWRMSRRMSVVYRSAAGALAKAGAPRAERWRYIRKMIAADPLAVKNLARALLWLLGK
jgi:glycosyltransferase involved in cell wall biosynthesis